MEENKEQDLIIKNGMIQLQLDRVGDKLIIVEIPEKYKDRILLDMWTKTEIKAYNTILNKPTLHQIREFKGWILNKDKNKLILINHTDQLK